MLAWFWKMFTAFDSKVLAVFTKFCHWFQRLTGRTNFWLARWVIACVALTVVAVFLKTITDFQKSNGINRAVILLCVTYTCIIGILGFFLDGLACEEQDNNVLNEEKSIQERIANQRDIKIRFIILCFLPMVIPKILSDIIDILALVRDLFFPILWIYVYLIAVNPLPPGTNKISEWIKGFFAKQKTAEANSKA